MADEEPSSSAAAHRSTNLITELNDNDVLLGRGTGRNEFIGNRRFRSIVEQHKEEYIWANGAKEKIAREIIDQIHALGGRFLKEVETYAPVHDVEERVWVEVEESVAIQKCKQALRDQNRERQRSSNEDGSLERNVNYLALLTDSLRQSSAGLLNRAAVAPPSPLSSVHGELTSVPMFSSSLHFVLPTTLDERLFLFPATTFALQQPAMINPFYPPQISHNYQIQNVLGVHAPTVRVQQGLLPDMHRTANEAAESAYQSSVQDNVSLQDIAIQGLLELRADSVTYQAGRGSVDARCPNSSLSSGEVVSAQTLLSALEDRPRFTKEQEVLERATLTEEEKAAALSDLFGRYCAVSTQKNKRAKLDVGRKSIKTLVQQMRMELEIIPQNEKQAMVEAQTKCREDEFSDAHLERFLRCEGMDAKLGAQRFVNYWESRRKLFGPEKFKLPMTLSEALRDDLVALETCLLRILPQLDASGRQLLLVAPCHHTREGYMSESMLRAVWYVIEVMAQGNTDFQSGVVWVIWNKDMTIWDYDRRLHDRIVDFDKNCWPVKRIASHICCPPSFFIKTIKPIIFYLMDKYTRSRVLFHDVPESQLLDVLSDYGIHKEMLSTGMGGTVQLDQAEWIAKRRALELTKTSL